MTFNPLGNIKRAGAGRRTRRSASTTATSGSASGAGASGNRPGRNGKFNAAGERVDGIWMASASEAERYRQLLRMEMAGRIDNLRTQVNFPLIVSNVLITKYRADFCYDVIDEQGHVIRSVIEDVKGMITPEFKLKNKLFNALEPVKLTVIHVKGQVKLPGADKASGAGWMHVHWADKIPD